MKTNFIDCFFCGKKFERSMRQIKESQKLKSKPYCSRACMGRDRLKRKTFVCGRPGCNKRFLRILSAISPHNYCSRSCMAIMNNKLHPRKMAPLKKCANEDCSEIFKKRTIFCSPKCQHKVARSYTSEALIEIIKAKATILGRSPAKRELPDIVSAVVNTFGSWNAGIKAVGLTPHRSDSERMYRRRITTARDGHKCDSISEAIIDNWLTERGIAHERDVKYPDTNHKADWVIQERIFVEYFGLANDSARYDRDIKTKRALCKKHAILLIAIYPKDLYPTLSLHQKFSIL